MLFLCNNGQYLWLECIFCLILCSFGISQMSDFLLHGHCWMVAGEHKLFCQGSGNLITSTQKLLFALLQCQNWTSTPNNRPDRTTAVCVPVWTGADKTRSLMRAKPLFFSCGCSQFHPPPIPYALLTRCTARRMWLNLAAHILHSPSSWAIRATRASKSI